MNEQARASSRAFEQRENEAPVSTGAEATPRTTRRGAYAKMAALKLRAGYTMPEPIENAVWIPLNKGLFALVDSDDATRISQWHWSALERKHLPHYAMRTTREKGKASTLYLHRFIMDAQQGSEVDHKDGNGWDCRRNNLRICTRAENSRNTRKQPLRKTTSRFKGVYWNKAARRWTMIVGFNKHRKNFGNFTSEISAAHAYNTVAKLLFGEFAKLNVIQPC